MLRVALRAGVVGAARLPTPLTLTTAQGLSVLLPQGSPALAGSRAPALGRVVYRTLYVTPAARQQAAGAAGGSGGKDGSKKPSEEEAGGGADGKEDPDAGPSYETEPLVVKVSRCA
jgi:hypothetical protein